MFVLAEFLFDFNFHSRISVCFGRCFGNHWKRIVQLSWLSLCIAARVITKSPYDTSSSLLLNKLKWEKLSKRRQTQKALIIFKTIHKLAPKYLHQLFTPRRSEYNLRNLEGKLALPKPHTNYLKRSFSYSGGLLWNNLPQEMRDTDSTGLFKRKISNRISDISDSHTAIM